MLSLQDSNPKNKYIVACTTKLYLAELIKPLPPADAANAARYCAASAAMSAGLLFMRTSCTSILLAAAAAALVSSLCELMDRGLVCGDVEGEEAADDLRTGGGRCEATRDMPSAGRRWSLLSIYRVKQSRQRDAKCEDS